MKLLPLLLVAALLLVAGCAQQAPPSPPAQNNAAQPAQPAGNAPPPQPAQNATPPAQPAQPPPLPQIKSQEFNFYSGGWHLYGTDYPSSGSSPTKAVILLHDVGQNRSAYPYYVIKKIHDSMPDTVIVTLDMQGNGQSVNIGTWDSFDTDAYRAMKTDVIDLGTKYIAPTHPSVKTYYVVGSGFGSTVALLTAIQEHRVTKIAMLSPGMEYKGVSIESAIPDYTQEMLLVSSTGDGYSAQSVGQISSMANKLQVFKASYDGSAHGTALFDATESSNDKLSDDLISFLKQP